MIRMYCHGSGYWQCWVMFWMEVGLVTVIGWCVESTKLCHHQSRRCLVLWWMWSPTPLPPWFQLPCNRIRQSDTVANLEWTLLHMIILCLWWQAALVMCIYSHWRCWRMVVVRWGQNGRTWVQSVRIWWTSASLCNRPRAQEVSSAPYQPDLERTLQHLKHWPVTSQPSHHLEDDTLSFKISSHQRYPTSLKKGTLKFTSLVRVEDVRQTKHAEHLHQFCRDGDSCVTGSKNGMCPLREIVLDDQKIVILTVWHEQLQDIGNNHLPWVTYKNGG